MPKVGERFDDIVKGQATCDKRIAERICRVIKPDEGKACALCKKRKYKYS